MEQGGQQVRLHEEAAVRRLAIEAAAYPQHLPGESLLIVPSADVLDHRVGEGKINTGAGEGRAPSVAFDEVIPISGGAGVRPDPSVQDDDVVAVPERLPVPDGATEVDCPLP